jgi:hypothetical protein
MMMSSIKDSDGYTTVSHRGGSIMSSPKLHSQTRSTLCTNSDGIRRNPFDDKFVTTFLPTFSNSPANKYDLTDAVPAMIAKYTPGFGEKKMKIGVKLTMTGLYADEEKIL